MTAMLNLTVLVISVLIQVIYVNSVNLGLTSLPIESKYNPILSNEGEEEDDDEREAPEYGTLHTLEQYGEWAAKEEKLVNLIETRLEILKKEEELMMR